jgi:hypothetical protein
VEGLIRGVLGRRRLVRRDTLTLHQVYVQRELAFELTASTLLLGCLTAGSLVGVAPSWRLATFMNIAAFTVTHLLFHSALLSLAFSAAARLGTVRALGLGLTAILGCVRAQAVSTVLLWKARMHVHLQAAVQCTMFQLLCMHVTRLRAKPAGAPHGSTPQSRAPFSGPSLHA